MSTFRVAVSDHSPEKGTSRVILRPMIALICGLFGLIIGSFLNVVVLRRGAGVLTGRSVCMSCGRELGISDLVHLVMGIFARTLQTVW